MIHKRQHVFGCTLVLVLHSYMAWARGGIATDGTMGAAQTLSGSTVTIPQALGTTVGRNLFHSFSEFNIANGQTIEFSGGDSLQNVISRVTGKETTDIQGTLKSSIANAAFYFINPNGVTFGKDARIDMHGAFHVGTATTVLFPNGGVFAADSRYSSMLSSEAPADFGFLATSAANNGLININGAKLSVASGQTLDAVAGTISVESAATLSAASGELRLTAIQGAGVVDLQQTAGGALPLPALSASNGGTIVLDAATIDASGNGAGRIALWGGNIQLSNSKVIADNNGIADAMREQGTTIRAYSLNVDNSVISSNAISSGSVGNIMLEAVRDLKIVNGGSVESNNFDFRDGNFAYPASGKLGNIKVSADTLSIDGQGNPQGAGISSQALFSSSELAGRVIVQTKELNVLNGGKIFSSKHLAVNAESLTITGAEIAAHPDFSYGSATGGDHGASVTITGTKKLDILDGGSVSVSSVDSKAGHVNIQADNVTIDGKGNLSSRTGIFSENVGIEGVSAPGGIAIQVEKMTILNGGMISSSSSNAIAGSIEINADTLSIDGGGDSPRTGIFSDANETIGYGYGGNIALNTGMLSLDHRASISSDTHSLGWAGFIKINTAILDVLGGSNISSASKGSGSGGIPGTINIKVNERLRLAERGHISIENEADRLSESGFYVPGFIFGALNIEASEIDVHHAWITSHSSGGVAAGTILVNFSRSLTMDASFITTTANTGDGGDIVIGKNSGLISLHQSGFTTSVSGENGNGGDIFAKADILLMDSGIIQANAESGDGGDINLKLNALIPSGNTLVLGGQSVVWSPSEFGFNLIQAASDTGLSGKMNVAVPQLNLSSVLANFGGPQFDIAIINPDDCNNHSTSSLTYQGTGGLKPKSGDTSF